MQGFQMPTWWSEKVMEPLRASPQKATAIAALLAVLVVLWGRLILGSHNPQSASAMPALFTSSDSQGDPITSSPNSYTQADSLQKWAREKVVPLSRNLFTAPLDFYPSDDGKAGNTAAAGDGFWDRLGKTVSSRADQSQQRQILAENLRVQAGSLKLESTLTGENPEAMVSGEVVRAGSVVQGFRVLEILDRKIIFEREGIKLEVSMN